MREEKGQEDGLVKCRETARRGRRPGRAGKAEGDQATQSTGKPNFFLTLSRFSPMPPLTGPFRLSSTQTLPLVFDAHPHGEQPVRSDDFFFFLSTPNIGATATAPRETCNFGVGPSLVPRPALSSTAPTPRSPSDYTAHVNKFRSHTRKRLTLQQKPLGEATRQNAC